MEETLQQITDLRLLLSQIELAIYFESDVSEIPNINNFLALATSINEFITPVPNE